MSEGISPLSLTPSSTPDNDFVKHQTHYYSDGSVIFIVEKYLFRVYKDLLARRSQVMKDLFGIPQQSISSSDQLIIDGVPAITLTDSAAHFANLLDLIMPGAIGEAPVQTFDRLEGIYSLSDKYVIDDIRDWAVSWLEDLLPSTEDDIVKLATVYTDVETVARVIAFAQTKGFPQFLPLAFYALSSYPWNEGTFADYSAIIEILSPEDQYRLQAGRLSLQKEVLSRNFELPDLGLGSKALCSGTANGQLCARSRVDPKASFWELLQCPLEELDQRVRMPNRQFCNKCVREGVESASRFRHVLFKMLPKMFLLVSSETVF